MASSAPLSILLIDDSPEDRLAVRMFLSESSLAGCIIHEADSGATGLVGIRRLHPDCVLLDYQLGDMTGFDVLDEIRSSTGDPAFAVIILTGSDDEALAAAAMQTGAQDYLPKDLINGKSLPLAIRNAIGRFGLIKSRREHEQRLKVFIDRAPAAVAMFDCEMRFREVSRRFVRDAVSYFVEPDELIGRGLYEIMPDLPDTWRTAHRRVLGGETLMADEDCFRRADGRVDWWRWEMTPWLEVDGAVGGVLLFAERINARKQAEDALRVSEERLRISQQAGRIGCWDRDIVTGRGYWSAQQCQLFGLDPILEGPFDHDRWTRLIHPEDRPRIREEVRSALAPQTAKFATFVHRIVLPASKGGAVRWIHTYAEVKRDPQGTPVRMLGVSMDITERRETELQLRLLTEELEQRVAEEVAARHEVQARLVQTQRMEALGQLAGGIAHDFNNVLQAISGALTLIERHAHAAEAVRRFAAMAAEATDRGAAVTGRLLTFSRAGALKLEPIAPLALLEGQREMLGHVLGRLVAIKVEADAELPPLLADKAQLETVLVNLAVNARDAMPTGGTLTLRAQAARVLKGTNSPGDLAVGDYLAVSVVDTGAGMDDFTLARASEPFFTTKPVGKGTGLGLSMARGFAQQSGGGFHIASKPGEGTTVTLWLPMARGSVEEEDHDTPATTALALALARTL